MTMLLRVPSGREPERRYAAHVLLGEFLGLEWELVAEERDDVVLELDGSALEYRDGLFGRPDDAWLQPASLPEPPLPLPYLWPDDPFGTAFFCLTRYEEIARHERDARDRFPAHAAVAPDRPLVNELLEQLWGDLRRTWPRLARKRRSFRVIPSHDVDLPFCGGRRPKQLAADLLRGRAPRLALQRIAGADPCDTFDWLMTAAERRGLKTAFYFIADDAEYPLARVHTVLRDVHARGHEVGLHPSYDTYRDAARLEQELARLRAACAEVGVQQASWGGRQHFLRWAPLTWQLWEDAGLAYDSTLGWSEAAGFRTGVCYEYPAFNLETRRMLQLRERPLIAMDTTFVQHLDLGDAALAAMVALKDTCRRYDGDFVLLWHNNRLQTAADRRLYEAVLDA